MRLKKLIATALINCGLITDKNVKDVAAVTEYLEAHNVLISPVTLGQELYLLRNKRSNEIVTTKVLSIIYKQHQFYMRLDCNTTYETSCNSIGKTIFLTKQKAETALNAYKQQGGKQ